MRTRSAALTAALCVFGLFSAACMLPADPAAGPTEEPSVATSPDPDPSASGRQSMEDIYTYETMDEYVDSVVDDLIEPWVQQTWPGMPLPRVRYVPHGSSGSENCTDMDGRPARFTSESYEYCAGTIYVGQDMLWTFFEETGDAGPAVGLAHEFGHHIQEELGLPPARTTDQSIRVENQADCLAGAWVNWVAKLPDVLEPEDDLADIEALFPLIGSAEGEDRDHGTAQERKRYWQAGYDKGISACGV